MDTKMKHENEHCKDCAEYGSEFCPECLDELEHATHHKHDIAKTSSNSVDLTTNCTCVTTMIDTNTYTAQVAFTTHGANIWTATVSRAAPCSMLSHNITVDQITLGTGLTVMMSWTGAPMPIICVVGQIMDSGAWHNIPDVQVF